MQECSCQQIENSGIDLDCQDIPNQAFSLPNGLNGEELVSRGRIEYHINCIEIVEKSWKKSLIFSSKYINRFKCVSPHLKT